jgi:hypothetical protein
VLDHVGDEVAEPLELQHRTGLERAQGRLQTAVAQHLQ